MERLFRIRCSQIGKIMSNAKVKGELSQTCKTYLHEWYANENEEIYSKYINKGNEVENDLIDFMAEQLGFGMASKCHESASNEFIQGSCDVLVNDAVIDVKASWNKKTLHQTALDGLLKDYEMQLQGYMELYNKDKAIVFHGLMNTPETDYVPEIVYDNLPDEERWVAFEVKRDSEFIKEVEQRVIQCREWLAKYDVELKSKLGKIN